MEKITSYEKENQTYWTKRAPSYATVHQGQLESTQHTIWRDVLHHAIERKFPGLQPEAISVLDVGTGPGFFAILLAELGYNVTAVDYTPAMLEEAKMNAGTLANAISFQAMNGEALTFADETFHVVVSRNLTWNLPHPDQAYREWTRVLRDGGLLLNFDANWYRYLYDVEARKGYDADRKAIIRAGVANETDGTDIPAMEAIAEQAPLSARLRPLWDTEILTALGLRVTVDETIWQTVWDETQQINNSSTPMFMIQAVKELQS